MLPNFKTERRAPIEADICLIAEGCYPYVPGGVSNWIDGLIRSFPEFSFSVVAILGRGGSRRSAYAFPNNLVHFQEIELHQGGRRSFEFPGHGGALDAAALADTLADLLNNRDCDQLARIQAIFNQGAVRVHSLEMLMNSPKAWKVITQMYEQLMPHASFHSFFWAWRALFGGLFAILKAPLPPAKIYHTVSTGYAGLFAARAKLETGRPVFLTEHGIYTNERRVEILMADWIADTIDKGLALGDDRFDLREMWIAAFEAYARICYQSCDEIITLYEDNQRLQKQLDADENRLQIIPNGIDLQRFSALPRAGDDARPTIALIGRVVPIKDVKSFITAAMIARRTIPDLQALILGPEDENPEYARECRTLVSDLDLSDCVQFNGAVNIADYLPQIHAVALTSLSEAQPLVLLEAGGAGVPCIATDVGSCRELLEGRADEAPQLGHGGFICDLVAPEQVAAAAVRLLQDSWLRQRYGDTMRKRVSKYYLARQVTTAYEQLYHRYGSGSSASLLPAKAG